MKHKYYKILTPGQARIYESVILGLNNEEIAKKHDLTESGVKYHLTRIFDKFNVRDKHQLSCNHYRGVYRDLLGEILSDETVSSDSSGFFSVEDSPVRPCQGNK